MAKNLIGTTFHSVYADGNPLWRVTKKVGPNAWKAVCDDEDWGGTVKLFSTKEIENHKNFEKHIDDVGNEQERFYNSLKVGKTVHYCNGFSQFVECTVVLKDGKKVLQPVALKGNWQKWELPYRQNDGLIHLGYHATKITNRETFTPNYTTILEAPMSAYKQHSVAEVAKLPRINLEVPPMNERQQEVAKITNILRNIMAAMDWHLNNLNDQTELSTFKEVVASSLDRYSKKLRS